MSPLKEYLERLQRAVAPAVVVGGVLTLLARLGLLSDTVPAPFNWVLVFLIMILIVILYITVPAMRRLWEILLWVPRNLQLLFFGQIALHQRVNEIYRLNEPVLFGRIAGFESIRSGYYHILYTHKGENHPYNPGPNEQYRIPGFPYDEAEAVMQLWYYAAQNLRIPLDHIRPRCSCSVGNPQLQKRIFDGSYAIVGSPVGNRVCSELMERIEVLTKERILVWPDRYIMKVGKQRGESDDNRRCYLHADEFQIPQDLWPDSTLGAVTGTTMIDYAVFMKLPNMLALSEQGRRETVLVLAGCKAAGQFALTEWLSNPMNLRDLERKYTDKYFYVFLEVRYQYAEGGNPIINNTRLIFQNEITSTL